MASIILFIVVVATILEEIAGHGYMIEPPNRASLWRIDWRQLQNYDDNAYFCGGVDEQYGKNGGKCGECGDNYSDPKPRTNENGGTYGQGLIWSNYTSGSVIETNVQITANHLGYFKYSLCAFPQGDWKEPEEEECFQDLPFADGSSTYPIAGEDYDIRNHIKLPDGLTCEHCVLRWHYSGGNSWGLCSNGTEALGCGNQETFRSCADISIY